MKKNPSKKAVPMPMPMPMPTGLLSLVELVKLIKQHPDVAHLNLTTNAEMEALHAREREKTMKLTNNYGLPDALVRAVKNDSYNPGTSDYTATSLLRPPRIAQLQRQYAGEITEDASDRIWALLGQATHTILERAGGNELKEERLYADFHGVSVSAQTDNLCMEKGALCDYKITTAWKFKGDKPADPDYVAQLNIQAEILRRNKYVVSALFIVGILRDWSKLEAVRNADYPRAQVIKLPIPLWPEEQATAFINLRIANHENAKRELPECTDSERWRRDTVYAVVKNKQKKAIKLFAKEDSAIGYADSLGGQYAVVTRPGEAIRCANYCQVSEYCLQYQDQLTKEQTSAYESPAR